MRLLIILGAGGHTRQMLRLVELLGGEYEYHYVVADYDTVSEHKIVRPGLVYRVLQPREKRQGRTESAGAVLRKLPLALRQAWQVLDRAQPDAIIGAGPSLQIPFALLARLRRIPHIFIESASRPETLTFTGRLIYHLRLADRFYVQWEHHLARYPRARYAGRLL
ncbi:MAG: UDP-N-acetylglucosamine transferase subunit ALG14 [Caldilineales bacterium]|nr:UDP-N-acetylglucosamine transferase subunit ALG14 [Caldilineales bacterium]